MTTSADVAEQFDPNDPKEAADFAARIRAAAVVRRLGHAIVGHEIEPDLLHGLADELERRLPPIENGAPRSRMVEIMKRNVFHQPADGQRIGTFPDCVVSGDANPMGMGVGFFRRGDEAVAHVTLGPAFEGAPDRAHGGVVAAIFDDLMGFVLHILGTPAFTGELTVRYLAPTPVKAEIEFRAWLRDRQERKIWIEAEAVYDGTVAATASGLFIAIPAGIFGIEDAC